MKITYRDLKNNFLSMVLILTSIASLAIFVQSCSSDEDEFNSNHAGITTRYLDINVMSNTKFTPKEMEILASAIERASKYLVFDGEKYVFELESGNEINISNRLFEYIYPSMQNVEVNLMGIPRLKFDSEFKSGIGYTQYTMNLTHKEALEYYQAMSSANSYGSTALSAIVGSVNAGVGTAIAVGGLIYGETLSYKYSQYVNSGSSRGITIVVTNTYTPNIPGCNIQTTQILNR